VREQSPPYDLLEAVPQATPTLVAELARPLGRADDVDDEDRREDAVDVRDGDARAGDELLDCAEQLRMRQRHVVRAVDLDESRVPDLLGEVPAVIHADECVVAAVDQQGRCRDERQDVTDVELVDRPRLRDGHPRRAGEPFDAAPPLDDAGSLRDRRSEHADERARSPLRRDLLDDDVLDLLRHPGGVVVVPSEAREAVVEDERRDPLRVRRGGHERELRRVALGDDGRLPEARRVRDRGDVVDPVLGREHPARHGVGQPQTAHVEPEHPPQPPEHVEEVEEEGLLPEHLQVAGPVEHEDELALALAEDLVRELELPARDVLRSRWGHRGHSRAYPAAVRICPSCGRENAEDARFCSQCATPLETEVSAREERKVVTCLFCDLVGFTARAEQMDPEDVRRVLQPYHTFVRAELERFGGTVEKFIGDAVMAVFGAPIAHEDDPERAVRAALAIRDQIADEGELEVRIGITTGEALVALGARPETGEGMASGDVVNTAARLQTAAPVNGILVDETTYRATERAIDYGERRSVEAKGKAEPIPVWEATRARARVAVEREARAPLVGRRREVLLLRETLERAHSGREAQLVTLVGVPGIGKSRLVYELFKTVELGSELVYWRHGRSLPYGDGVTFWALSEIVKAQAGILETDDHVQAESKLQSAVEAVAGDEDPRWLERNLRPLVGLETGGVAEDRRTEAFAAWRRFLEALAEHRPLVLVFEDLHWADDAMLDFVDHLVEWARGVPLLVVATARPELLERRPGWGGGKPNAATLSLPPLEENETAELVHALLETPVLPAATRDELVARAGGNPLYAEEFARLVTEGRTPAELPETVQGLIAARLDALGDDEKSALQAAAVVGRTFWLGSISSVAASPRWTTEEHLHALERKDFVRRERRSSVAGEDEYSFRHLLIRDVAYGQIPRVERGYKHRLVAEWIESLGRPEDHAELVAQHYVSALELANATSQPLGDIGDRARDALIEAGDRATALTSFPSASRFYEHALELLAADDERRGAELRLRLGRALVYMFDERAEPVLEEASRALLAAESPQAAGEAQMLLSVLWWDRGKRDRSFEHLDEAQRLIGTDASESRAQVLARFARAEMIAGEYDQAIPAATEVLAIAEQLGLDAARIHALTTLGVARFELGDAAWLEDLERSIEIALDAGSHLGANAYNNLGFMYTQAGDVRRDYELRQEAMRLAERFGDERILHFTRLCMPMLEYYAGEWDRALMQADDAVESFEAGTPHYLEANIRWTRALLRNAVGQDQSASVDALRAVEVAREAKDPQMILPALAVRLHVARENERLDTAAEAAVELLGRPALHLARSPAIELAFTASALQNAADVRRWIESVPYASLWSDAALAILDGELERTADVFAEIGSLPDEAYARLRAAERHAADGRRAEAEELLQRSLAFWRSVGATRYIRQAESLRGELEVPA